MDMDDQINIIVYPTREFADYFSEGAVPIMMEIHDFCRECKRLFENRNVGFAVFPNEESAIRVSTRDLYEDVINALMEVEDLEEEFLND